MLCCKYSNRENSIASTLAVRGAVLFSAQCEERVMMVFSVNTFKMSRSEPTWALITTYRGNNVCEKLLAGPNGRVALKYSPDKSVSDHTLTSAKDIIISPGKRGLLGFFVQAC